MSQVVSSVVRNVYTLSPGATAVSGFVSAPPTSGCTFISAQTLQSYPQMVNSATAGQPPNQQYIVDSIVYWLLYP